MMTDRLYLRPFALTDAEDVYALNADPAVLRYTGDEPFASVAAARAFLETYDQYERYGYGRWAVIDHVHGRFLGWCGLKYHPAEEETDLGYRFHRRYWGRGYATEAGRACVRYGLGKLGLPTIVGRVATANAASVRVLEKCGLRYWKPFLFDGQPGHYYRIDAGDPMAW